MEPTTTAFGTRTTPFDAKVDQAAGSAHSTVNSIAQKASVAADKVKPALDRVTARAHDAIDKAAGAAAPTAEWISEQARVLDEQQRRIVNDTTDYVQKHPLKSVLMAAGAGYILGKLL